MKHLSFGILAFLAIASGARADSSLTNGAVVRISSHSIEEGWHAGRLHRDTQNCWMVKLDTPTKDHYTMLSLLVVDQLQLAAGSAWNSVSVKPVLQASPAVCREYGAD
ncbi:MAG: hypothetical protein ACJ8MH_08575 [Povalibacter sp.]